MASLKALFSKSLRQPLLLNSHQKLLSTSLFRQQSQRDEEELRPPTSQADSLTAVGCRSIFNNDHDIFRESVRKFYKDEVIPNIRKWEADGQVSREVWLKAGEQGLLGINTPTEHGGIGGTFLDTAIVMEEQAYAHFSGLGFALHSDIVMPYITHCGSKEQIDKYIPDMVTGRKIGAIAMTEPSAGSDLQGIKTHAKKVGDDWVLNGSKTFITNGYMADTVIVVAVTNPEAKSIAHGLSLFLVDEGMPGFKKGKKLEKLGFKAQDTAELFFDDVRLPNSALLGSPGHGFYYLMQELPQERLIIGLACAAACEAMFETTKAYVLERKAFGKTISKFQTIQHKMAEMKTEICIGRAFVDQCLKLHDEERLDGAMASMCKYWLSDLGNKVAYDCLQLHGGWGYMMEYDIARAYRDMRLHPIFAGTNEIMKELIARTILTQ